MKIIPIMLVMTLITACVSIRENQPTGLPPISMQKADIDGDGNLDEMEFNVRLDTLFELRDKNQDGAISEAELPGVNQESYQSADDNADGELSKQEYIYLRSLDFQRLDQDQDRVLIPREILSW